ncbi:hypothetical protein [Piscinibacter sakaiensis]|uniref:hypothetical protein n=1 Tax=Piscinibacter sakaiensis TaxID=1547922 RepID=UPI00372D55C2
MLTENRIRACLRECAQLIAPDGTEILYRIGTVSSVSFLHQELATWGRGATLTHNHPNGQSFSLEDVSLAMAYALREVRVVTTTHRHVATMFSPSMRLPLGGAMAAEEARAAAACRDDVRRGLMNPADFGVTVRHRTWQRLARSLGFDYWREQS